MRVRETEPEAVEKSQEAGSAHAEKTADTPIVGKDDLETAKAYLFSAPARYGVVASQLRSFIE